jgi:hypothetical protein
MTSSPARNRPPLSSTLALSDGAERSAVTAPVSGDNLPND